MSRRAWSYVGGVLLAGLAFSALTLPLPTQSPHQWLLFAILTISATLAQLFEAEAPGRQSFYAHTVFFFAGVLLLHPFLFALLVVIPHLVEWLKARATRSAHLRAWYIQPFNMATHIVAGVAAQWIAITLLGGPILFATPLSLAVLAASALCYIVINHLMVGQALVLARGISWRDSGVLDAVGALPEFVMACLGAVVAALWPVNPWLILPALSTLVPMYRALLIPQLKQEAQTDGKTGLSNARHFEAQFSAELLRATRFERPLALIVADLDLLRDINNSYGHQAGDSVLAGIGETIRATLRDYDIAGRFGGEEFALVLPETRIHDAQALAERLRRAIAARPFTVATNPEPIHVTMSLGVACFPWDATTTTDLFAAADAALYRAKANGRNRVVSASPPAPRTDAVDETALAISEATPADVAVA